MSNEVSDEVKGKVIMYLIWAIILSAYYTYSVDTWYQKSINLGFFEAIIFFIFSSFFSFVGITVGGIIRSFLGDIFTVSDTLMGLFFQKIFFAIGFQTIGLILGVGIGGACALSILR